ncbi:MAG: alanine racemase [Peptostreptococcaceae bacterium]|nr:alanine racemase [Peptostreptococcaceae bacterium]
MYKDLKSTWVEINLDNLINNFNEVKKILREDTKVCAVLKADAYGHGALQIAKVLEEQGVDYFAVATLQEGLELRNNNIKKPILCLGYINELSFNLAIKNDISFTIYKLKSAIKLNKIAKEIDKKARVHIKIDTGMSRLGFSIDDNLIENIKIINDLDNIYLEGIYTHFPKADEKDKDITLKQYQRYKKIIDLLENKNIKIPIKHVSNSATLIDLKDLNLDMVRPGILLYGHYPSNDVNKSNLNILPVMTLKTTVSMFKRVRKGQGISYGFKYYAKKDTNIATVSIGYADGFTRMLSGKIDVKINNKSYKQVGNICMDQCMIDLEDDEIKIGDEVIIFDDSKEFSIQRISNALNTIDYEILCMISRRVPRFYIQDKKILHKLDYLIE